MSRSVGPGVLGADGRYWFVASGTMLYAVDDDGHFSKYVNPHPHGLEKSYDFIVKGADGRIWMDTQDGAVAVATNGTFTNYSFDFKGLIAGSQSLWAFGENEIVRVAFDGTIKHFPIPHERDPDSLLFEASNGEVWYVCTPNEVLCALKPDGSVTFLPIHFSRWSSHAIEGPGPCLWTSDGRTIQTFTGASYRPSGFGDPGNLAADGIGNVWFTEENANAVGVVRSNGDVNVYALRKP